MQRSAGTGIVHRLRPDELEFEGHGALATVAAFPISTRHIARIFIQYNLIYMLCMKTGPHLPSNILVIDATPNDLVGYLTFPDRVPS